jgi:hypothetical protein
MDFHRWERNKDRHFLDTRTQLARSLDAREEATMLVISGISSGFWGDMAFLSAGNGF